jgi:uncharacterized membrane-anchored protein
MVRSMLREHPARREIVGEMHLRRWPLIGPGMRIVQIVRLADPDEEAEEQSALLARLAIDRGGCEAGRRHVSATLLERVKLTWERHSEASTLSLFVDAGAGELDAAVEWVEGLPGAAVRATKIWIVADEPEAAAVIAQMPFDPLQLVSCTIGDGARIWSDFRIRDDGYGCLVVAANGLAPSDVTRAVQRLQELGNYRNLALLGLPVAREAWPRLDEAENALRNLGDELARTDVRDDELLERLCRVSLGLAALAAATGYRMSATAAYAQLVEERLTELRPEPIAGYPSLFDFTQRRLLPAVRTCSTFAGRERELTRRTAHVTSLLRTRIETRIENQNARMLGALNRSAKMQLRLQDLVEGLSVVAISYYSVSLLRLFLAELGARAPSRFSHPIKAAAVPIVIGLVFVGLRHLRRRALRELSVGPGSDDSSRSWPRLTEATVSMRSFL